MLSLGVHAGNYSTKITPSITDRVTHTTVFIQIENLFMESKYIVNNVRCNALYKEITKLYISLSNMLRRNTHTSIPYDSEVAMEKGECTSDRDETMIIILSVSRDPIFLICSLSAYPVSEWRRSFHFQEKVFLLVVQ